MQFTDEGFIIGLRKHGESSLILTVLTHNYGKITGYVKNCMHKKNLSTYQLGNSIKINAYSRIDENMLSLKVELNQANAVNFMLNPHKLSTLSAFCSLCCNCLPEYASIERLFYYANNFFSQINQENWLAHYCYFEFYLLDNLGIGLDLSECAATGTTQNLRYVSPKSGKAVCEEAGFIYKEKLFRYPTFIIEQNYSPSDNEMLDLLKMTEFFLQKNFFQTHGLKFPPNRANLLSNLNL